MTNNFLHTSFSAVAVAIVAGLLNNALVCMAAPLTPRQGANTTMVSNTTLLISPPSSINQSVSYNTTVQAAQPLATFYPVHTSQYNARNGAVAFDTEDGLVSRNPQNGGADMSTLVTFTIDTQYSARRCQLVFDLTGPDSSVSGSLKAQLFTSLAPATASTSSWPSGNLRNQALGSIDVVAGSRATWEAGSGPGATVNGYFPCKTIAGRLYGGEVVPQGDTIEISWPAGQDGIKILVW